MNNKEVYQTMLKLCQLIFYSICKLEKLIFEKLYFDIV